MFLFLICVFFCVLVLCVLVLCVLVLCVLVLWLFYADLVYIFILLDTDTSAGKSVDISSFTVPRRYKSRAIRVSIAKFQRKNNPSYFVASLSPPFPPINQSARHYD